MQNNSEPELSSFALDVRKALTNHPKKISSKYFYNDHGSRIFQEIMEMPEYYLTDAEHEILETQSDKITKALNFEGEFSIIELGAGDGKKTLEFLSYLTSKNLSVHYRPVDISEEAIQLLQTKLTKELPTLIIEPLIGDYFHVLEALPKRKKPAIFLFLGSNIGNYEIPAAKSLMSKFGSFLQAGDKMMVGFDLKKSPRIIQQAYDDKKGITKRFNLNLLDRMNNELGMNFNLSQFEFYPYYNPNNGELRSCIFSKQKQEVHSIILNESFHFDANELLHTELSKKFNYQEIEEIANDSGFRIVEHFTDSKNFFTDSLWEKY